MGKTGARTLNSPSLNPTRLDRISRALHPDFARTMLARRMAAGFLVLLAGAAALRPDPAGAYTAVAVTVRDLRSGITVTADDVIATLKRHTDEKSQSGALGIVQGISEMSASGDMVIFQSPFASAVASPSSLSPS